MMVVKLAAIAVVCSVLSLSLKRTQPSFGFLVSLCGALCVLAVVAGQLDPLVAWLRTLAKYTQGQSLSCLLQILGIAIIAQLAADLCQESGMEAAASLIELGGRILALMQALPLLQGLIGSFLSLLQ